MENLVEYESEFEVKIKRNSIVFQVVEHINENYFAAANFLTTGNPVERFYQSTMIALFSYFVFLLHVEGFQSKDLLKQGLSRYAG
jgi:hypothetical protein